jgi:hypothetical protein
MPPKLLLFETARARTVVVVTCIVVVVGAIVVVVGAIVVVVGGTVVVGIGGGRADTAIAVGGA